MVTVDGALSDHLPFATVGHRTARHHDEAASSDARVDRHTALVGGQAGQWGRRALVGDLRDVGAVGDAVVQVVATRAGAHDQCRVADTDARRAEHAVTVRLALVGAFRDVEVEHHEAGRGGEPAHGLVVSAMVGDMRGGRFQHRLQRHGRRLGVVALAAQREHVARPAHRAQLGLHGAEVAAARLEGRQLVRRRFGRGVGLGLGVPDELGEVGEPLQIVDDVATADLGLVAGEPQPVVLRLGPQAHHAQLGPLVPVAFRQGYAGGRQVGVGVEAELRIGRAHPKQSGQRLHAPVVEVGGQVGAGVDAHRVGHPLDATGHEQVDHERVAFQRDTPVIDHRTGAVEIDEPPTAVLARVGGDGGRAVRGDDHDGHGPRHTRVEAQQADGDLLARDGLVQTAQIAEPGVGRIAVHGEQPLGQRNARLLVGGGADLADAGEIGEAERRAQRAVEIEQGLEETALAVAARAQQVVGVLQMVAHERRRRNTAQHAGVVHVRGDRGGRLEAQDGAVTRELLVVQRHRPRRIEPRIIGHDDLAAAQQADIGEADARLEDGQPGMFGERGPDELVVPLVPLLRQREQVRGGPPAVLPARPQLPLGVEGQLRIAGQGQAQHVRGLGRALQLMPGMADGVGDADRPAVAAEEVEFLRQWHAGQPLNHMEPVAVHDAADHGEVLIRHRRERREIQFVQIVHDCVSSFGEGKGFHAFGFRDA